MKELLEKLSSYNIFNYLLPGVIFSYSASILTRFNLLQEDILAGVFVYYFIGLVVSRLGSIALQPILEFIFCINLVEYEDFIEAAKPDSRIDVLSEANNMYRTFCSLFVILAILKFYEQLETVFSSLQTYSPYVLIVFLLLLFGFSYKKQTNFIIRRIKAAL